MRAPVGMMIRYWLGTLLALSAVAAQAAPLPADPVAGSDHSSRGKVMIGGRWIRYSAEAGTIPVHGAIADKSGATMSYVAYFAHNLTGPKRPVTFLFNGGPGASSLWLQMAAFGPRRIAIEGTTHTSPAPYRLVDNADSLLDSSDLVFIDAPGTGFGSALSSDDGKQFFGIDQDAAAFAQFIPLFLSRYDLWNVPKFILGESYGAMRAAVLANLLQSEQSIDINGIVLLSPILSYNLSANLLDADPGADHAFVTTLPSYAATAWYQGRLAGGRSRDLNALIDEAETFASGDYAQALSAGLSLASDRRRGIAERLATYTGLPVDVVLRANLRITPEVFETRIVGDTGLFASRLDTRFLGASMDPLSKTVDYDPQAAATTAAFLAGYNDYARHVLGYGATDIYRIDASADWNWSHRSPGARVAVPWIVNVMGDLAAAIKYNPHLRVSVHTGIFDLSTPFFESAYEMNHLPIPSDLMSNLAMHRYPSGHQIYLDDASLVRLHDDIAAFIIQTVSSTPQSPSIGKSRVRAITTTN